MTSSRDLNRRNFLRQASTVAAVPAAASLLALNSPGAAHAVPKSAATGTLPDYAPIPASAFGPAVNQAGYYVGHVRGNLYWVTDGFYQAMFLTTTDGVVMVDAPPTIGRNLLRAIEEVTTARNRPSRVTHLIYSHSHADHIGAASIFGRGVTRIAHSETKRLLKSARDNNRPLPTITFSESYDLRVGGERLHLSYHGPNHSPDNIFIHVPSAATLMVVDVIFPGWAPFKNLAESQDIPAWIATHDTVLASPWQTLIGGHLGRLGTRADVTLQRAYVHDLAISTRDTLNTLDPTPFFTKYGPTGNAWAIFKSYLDTAAEQAAAPVIAKYTGQLAAADVFTPANAATMVNSTRIDAGILGPFGIHP
ncbi:MBL fold metallo-hydrolase [Acrocarpospora phusangensis]|uniref:MBL fold metallo-hydrolase n=1 Tax=Acrocarpospora phusangensis TaxID=1070424 RepID=A0A919Q841_9ACTN|nr:MBL fold metallo-hydrolase [Acrocarpospora phusangensis]GIH23286.1 MBL fold metallo-hydrolase [Acrocarpospora phusangensis]